MRQGDGHRYRKKEVGPSLSGCQLSPACLPRTWQNLSHTACPKVPTRPGPCVLLHKQVYLSQPQPQGFRLSSRPVSESKSSDVAL